MRLMKQEKKRHPQTHTHQHTQWEEKRKNSIVSIGLNHCHTAMYVQP